MNTHAWYWMVLSAGIAAVLASIASWTWHRMDRDAPDPAESDTPWAPEQWAQHQNHLRRLRIVRLVGVGLLFWAVVWGAVGMIGLGIAGLQS